MEKWNRWQDWANVVLGVILFITPFVFGATGNTTVAFTAYIGGVLACGLSLVGMSSMPHRGGRHGDA